MKRKIIIKLLISEVHKEDAKNIQNNNRIPKRISFLKLLFVQAPIKHLFL
jgi:hypothetical protein